MAFALGTNVWISIVILPAIFVGALHGVPHSAAATLPVWMLLTPRAYLSTFMKIGTIAFLVVGVMILNPELKAPAFSSCVSVAGPFSGMPFGPDGHDDVSELIKQHRAAVPMAEHITSQDPPLHTRTRAVLTRIMSPAATARLPPGQAT